MATAEATRVCGVLSSVGLSENLVHLSIKLASEQSRELCGNLPQSEAWLLRYTLPHILQQTLLIRIHYRF